MVKSTSAPFRSSLPKALLKSVSKCATGLYSERTLSYFSPADVGAISDGLVTRTEGQPDGWPSNDVPLVVMYSTNMENLTRMRRLVQASGVRFLGYDRIPSLLDALSVLIPVAVLVDEEDSSTAHRLGRQILADDFTMTLVRLSSGAAMETVSECRKAVGASLPQDGADGPYAGQVSIESSPNRLVAAFGRLGILPRRLTVVNAS